MRVYPDGCISCAAYLTSGIMRMMCYLFGRKCKVRKIANEDNLFSEMMPLSHPLHDISKSLHSFAFIR